MELIQISQVMAQMEQTDKKGNPIPFSIDFITYNERIGEAGDVMKFDKAILVFPNKAGTRKFNSSNIYARADLLRKQGKSPSHVKNGTINLQTDGKVITKAHIWLIRSFNNQKVTLHIHG